MIFEIVQPCRRDSMAAECWYSRVFSWMCKLEIFIFLYCFCCSGLKADLSWTPFSLSVIMFWVYEVHISPCLFFFVFFYFLFFGQMLIEEPLLYIDILPCNRPCNVLLASFLFLRSCHAWQWTLSFTGAQYSLWCIYTNANMPSVG